MLQLAEQADVRISGVTVGHVISFTKDKQGTTEATIEMNSAYAPVRANMHAILRLKSLVGETFMQLIPHGNTGPYIPDNGHLSNTQVEPTVTLDQILSLFTPKVRNDFRIWQQSSAASFEGKGEAINADFASLQPFVESSNKLISILATQEGALRKVIKNTGVVFSSLAGRDHQLEGLIVSGERTFRAAASPAKRSHRRSATCPNSSDARRSPSKNSTTSPPTPPPSRRNSKRPSASWARCREP